MAKLTEKQKKFADYYIELGNATQAAINAGYAKRSAQQMGAENLLKPVIKSYIDERLEQIASERIMSAQEAVELLSSIARAEITEQVVVTTMEGAEVVDKPPDVKTRIIAIKEILKRYPDNDKLVEQQIRKLTADADLAEIKANTIKGLSDDGSLITIVDEWLDDE
ncbi:MAG: terminase small subunit [Pseudolactococcus laudensis]